MKKRTKVGLGIAALILGAITLTGCTQSFCSKIDSARMMYAYEPGFTRYAAGGSETLSSDDGKYSVTNVNVEYAYWDEEITGFRFSAEKNDILRYFNSIISTSKKNGFVTVDGSTLGYYQYIDNLVTQEILNLAAQNISESVTLDLSNEKDFKIFTKDVSKYSYVKFVADTRSKLWEQYDVYDSKARIFIDDIDKCPSNDFYKLYKSKLRSYASAYRTCLTTRTDRYGSYAYDGQSLYVDAKTWGEAWQKGLFEGLLVYPIGWLIDQIVVGFLSTGMSGGAAALMGIIFITLIVRSIMLLATIKQTSSNAKMTELQPEIQKIQAKYPNANTSQVEKQRMASEMNALYKKNKINPFMTLIVMVIQFPVFICVWGALSGSALLTNGSILGLKLSLGIKDVLFNATYWGPAGGYGAVTALFLFLLMAGAQTVSMLLPQWIQKSKAKKVAKLGKNPAQKSQNNQMKIFTYVMLAMIIFMGFSLVSAMGIYWFVGAVFSIAQTLITQLIMSKKSK